jgi:hypothetical protein
MPALRRLPASFLYVLLTLLAVPFARALGQGNPDAIHKPPKPEPPPCELPPKKPAITAWSVSAPIPPERLYQLTVRAFAESGHAPTASSPAGIEWSLGAEKDPWLGDFYVRTIRATIYPKDSGSVSRIEPLESRVAHGSQYSPSTISYYSLSQSNGGKGLRIWCAAKALADSLRAWSTPAEP